VEDHFNLESEYGSDEIEKKDVNQLIHHTISKLPERYSAIITMFYLNEMTIEEISEAMLLSVSNVKVMLHRSRNSLRDLILKTKLAEELQ
jgi:RNA polymerase sigma factor (sigma-70 family)